MANQCQRWNFHRTPCCSWRPGSARGWDASGHVLVDSPVGTIVDIGPRGFAILSLFSQPTRLGDAIDRLEREHGRSTDLAPTLSVLNMLIEESALVTPDAGRAPTSGWADPVEHARMLHDERRTGDYLAALAAAVRPDDVVLDIGTGSGVLAVAAARAGARQVYAVEASDIAEVAERVFEANGVQDRVTLLPGWSRQIELPEPADLLVAEVIGNEPLEEEILETTLDARRRLLAPGARLIPHTLTLFARPVLLPEAEVRQRAFGRAAVAALARTCTASTSSPCSTRRSRARRTRSPKARWSPPGRRSDRRSSSPRWTSRPSTSRPCARRPISSSSHPACVNAIALTFRAELYEGISHTLDPWTWPRVELGDVGVGAARPRRGRRRVRPARALPPSGPWSTGRAHLRDGRPASGD